MARSMFYTTDPAGSKGVMLENKPERKYIIMVVSRTLYKIAIRIAGVVFEEQP